MNVAGKPYPSDAWTVAEAVEAYCRAHMAERECVTAIWVTHADGMTELVNAHIAPLPRLGLCVVRVDGPVTPEGVDWTQAV